MNLADLKQLRLSLLRHLENAAGRRFGLGAAVLLQHVRSEGAAAELADVQAELDYLRDKGCVEMKADLISPHLSGWRITAAGRDYLAALQG